MPGAKMLITVNKTARNLSSQLRLSASSRNPCARITCSVVSSAKPEHAQNTNRAHGSDDGYLANSGVCSLTFQITSEVQIVKASKGANIYNAADHAGLHLPASCKQGSCSSCVGKVLNDKVSYAHEPQCLSPRLKAEGYVAICCATVVGDATVLTNQGAKLRVARALQLDRMRHQHG